MPLRSVHPLPPPRPCPRDCPHPSAAAPAAAAQHGDFTLRLSLRAPALRWAAALVLAVAGRCTMVARVDPIPATWAPAASADSVATIPASASPARTTVRAGPRASGHA